MSTDERQTHWEKVYQTKAESDVSWFEENPEVSLDLIRATGVNARASIVDIGGGASRLVDSLVDAGFEAVTVLDLSDKALATSRARLGTRGSKVRWVAADITRWQPAEVYDVWHDRAAFHFLVDPKDRTAYVERIVEAVRPGGHVIIGTFALDGPERCSRLPVVRYDAAALSETLGRAFELVDSSNHVHRTPAGTVQHFQFSRFRRLG